MTFRSERQAGRSNPFHQDSRIVICSYQFAPKNDYFLASVPWNLIIIDEANRLRNVYKKTNKQAKAFAEAIENHPKILLTATPLQNNLMELDGLISVADPLIVVGS